MFALKREQFGLLAPVFASMDFHLATQAILAGAAYGTAWADDPEKPGAGLLGHFPRFYLAGEPGNPAFQDAMKLYFFETLIRLANPSGPGLFILYYDSTSWEPILEQMFNGLEFYKLARQYFETTARWVNWQASMPEGFTLRLADEALLEDTQLQGMEALREEMCSERDSVAEFLERSFGIVPLCGDRLAGWCLSEYNLAERCEIGIATLEPFQRRGLATASTLAFLDLADQRGYCRVGWHCYTNNTPSVATARRAGLDKIADYSIYLVKTKV